MVAVTAPPRPSLPGPWVEDHTLRLWVHDAVLYIEHLERTIEQLEATQREATWRPDRESDLD